MLDKPKHLIEFVEDRPGQDYRYANRPDKIMNELGWKPQYDFVEGLKLTVQRYTEHMEWWESHVRYDVYQ